MPEPTRRRRPVRHHDAKEIRCPNPLCEKLLGTRKMLHGFEIDTCSHCGQDYLAWGAFGAADVTGLEPQEAVRYSDAHARLPDMLREIGVFTPAYAS